MKKCVAVLVLVLLAACGREGRFSREDNEISHVVINSSAKLQFGKPPSEHTLRVEFTMPRSFRVQDISEMTMTDREGRTWERWKDASLQETNGVQRVSATFEVAADSQVGVVHIGDLDVDVSRGRVTRTARTAPL